MQRNCSVGRIAIYRPDTNRANLPIGRSISPENPPRRRGQINADDDECCRRRAIAVGRSTAETTAGNRGNDRGQPRSESRHGRLGSTRITRDKSRDSYSGAIVRFLLPNADRQPVTARSPRLSKGVPRGAKGSRPVISREPVWHNKGIRKPRC